MTTTSSYEHMISDFKWNRTEKFNFAADVIDDWAIKTPDGCALWWIDGNGKEVKLSYSELARSSHKFCNVMRSVGLKKGDLVLLVMKPQPAWWEIVTACLRMGVIVSPGTTQLSSKDLEYRIKTSEAACEIAFRVKPERPVGMFSEYWKAPERMRESFRGDWYFTGDRAVRDEDGYFWFLSRSDDVIISSGYRIGPFEVESALIEHPAVAESAVVSSPDDIRGEVVKAFIVLANGYSASDELAVEIQNHVKSVTAPFKYPRKIEFMSELPKTVSGKIRRVERRAKEWA